MKTWMWIEPKDARDADKLFKSFFGGYKRGRKIRVDTGNEVTYCVYDPTLESKYDDNQYTHRVFFINFNDITFRRTNLFTMMQNMKFSFYVPVNIGDFNNIWR